MDKLFSIAICTYNGGSRIGKVLDHIISQPDYARYIQCIVVVDNNSNDNTKLVVEEYKKKCQIIEYAFEPKQGLTYARYRAIGYIDTEWLIFLDDDNYILDHWITNAETYIVNNPDVGIFNGKVVAYTEFPLSERQEHNLKICKGGLACTHSSMDDIDRDIDSTTWQPFGAGMVVKTKPLKMMVSEKPILSTGRIGDKLVSGEDGEIRKYVIASGYQAGFCNTMVMLHEMTSRRLEDDYLIELYKSFSDWNYDYCSNVKHRKHYILWRMRVSIICGTQLFVRRITRKPSDDEFKHRLYCEQRKVYLKNTIRDRIINR